MPAVLVCASLLLCATVCSAAQPWSLLPRGSLWNFYAEGAAPTNWHHPNFDDSTWRSGPAQLGYGDGDERMTIVANPEDAPITTYFRSTFIVTNRALLFSVTLRVLADDGFIVYVNGVERARRNLPTGLVTFGTFAEANLEVTESNFAQFGISPVYLQPNTNTIAVELHQHLFGLHDASFDVELLANVPFQRPSVEITNPSDVTVLQAGDVLVETGTSDLDGHVTHVDFMTNGNLFTTSLREPFSIVWSNPPPGRHALTARAYDNQGGHGISPPVHVQIGDVTSALRVVRGPYLQSGSSTSMVVRWRTDWPTNSLVRFGTNPEVLDRVVAIQSNTINHELLFSGLQSDTAYFYSVGSASETFASGPQFYFRTSPTNARPVRIWVIGDSGTADIHADAVRAAYENLTGTQHTDVWMMLGDNAYGEGSDAEYQRAVFANVSGPA